MTDATLTQHDLTRLATPLNPDPVEEKPELQNLIVAWADKKASARSIPEVFAAQIGITELDLYHWIGRLKHKIRALRLARVELEHGEKVDQKVAEKAENGSSKHAKLYYQYIEERNPDAAGLISNIQVNVGLPD